MAGWGIPVGCMPVGPSIREWGNLKTQGWRRTERVSSEKRVESLGRWGGQGGQQVSKQEQGFW